MGQCRDLEVPLGRILVVFTVCIRGNYEWSGEGSWYPASVGHGKKVLRGLWEREIDLYIVDSFGEGLRLSIMRNDMNDHLIITWLIIILCMHWSKLSTLIIIEVKPSNKSKDKNRCEKPYIARNSISNVWKIQFTPFWNFKLFGFCVYLK